MQANLETLKEELIAQKAAIEEKRGTVVVKNTNPSPSEITEGIKSIEIATVDLSDATATENEVLEGYTFYGGEDLEIKIGTRKPGMSHEDLTRLIFFNTSDEASEDPIAYTIPDNVTEIKHYLFCKNPHNLTITLPLDILKINEYAFSKAANIKFTNVNDLTSIKDVGSNAFEYVRAVDYEYLWPTVETIGGSAFANTVKTGDSIRLPATLTAISSYCFNSALERLRINTIEISTCKVTSFYGYTFGGLLANCDLFLSPYTTQISSYAFYRGCFNNITIPKTCLRLYDDCFGGVTTDALDTCYLKTCTFESETPPTFGRKVISSNNFVNGCKIYVPDTAVDAYKAVSQLAYCADYIYPMSQKP